MTTTAGPSRTYRARWSPKRALAEGLTKQAVSRVPVRVRYPDGHVVGGGGATSPVIDLLKPDALFHRMAEHPKIGLGEAYMHGEWAAAPGTDLADALTPFARSISALLPSYVTRLRRVVDRAIPASTRNSLTAAKRNIEAHYDLSNDLFAAFLDPSMTYSSAVFDEARPFAEQDLGEAQRRKIDAILDHARVGDGTRLLEIGSGCGELALRAARRGAHVTTITLSSEQLDLAQRKIEEAGLADRVEIRLQDYREVSGTFDAVVSVEMIEAVGEEYWPAYLEAIDRALVPGGIAVIQAITMDHHRMLATRNSYGWIQKHIFPGGLIPSVAALRHIAEEQTHLRISLVNAFGLHYAHTLRRWRQRFLAQWPVISRLGFDEVFGRKWEFYLAYSEAGFASGYLDVAHLVLVKQP